MSKADALKKANQLEGKLKGKPFLAGDAPGPEDAKAFNDLLGEDNMALARWSKHIASFTGVQRKAFSAAAAAPVKPAAAANAAAAPAGKGIAAPQGDKKSQLLATQREMQQRWEDKKIFEVDPPKEGEADNGKFMVTFPYPYMNGRLHLGHVFSLLKAEFAVSYNRLQGKRALFPFGFHCTGMPIQAAANKLKREYEVYGSPCPKFPCGRPTRVVVDGKSLLLWGAPTSTAHQEVTGYILETADSEKATEWTKVKEVGAELTDVDGKKKVLVEVELEQDRKYFFRAIAKLADGTTTPASAVSEEVKAVKVEKKEEGKKGKKKGPAKIAAKSGDALHQWDIMRGMGLEEADITKFVDPMQWLDFFPPQGKVDLKLLGVHVDFRRSFITTAVNPFYDAFIRWQFNKLRAGNRLAFGKRPTIYSELDKQACMDHDRAEGEGVGHAEYTAIKIRVVEPMPEALKGITDKPIYLLCGTLRPETMIGQTNCWILPEGEYGVFNRGEEVVVCSDRAARNMSFQDIFPKWGQVEKLKSVTGKELMGASLSPPRCPYKVVHLLPLTTIKMDKMTGIVTSVPADSPDDYAAFMDLKNPKKREFYGVKAEWVDPFEPVPLIDVMIDGQKQTKSAEYICKKLGVATQKDTDKLKEAHDICYKVGFYEGVMAAGEFKGMSVQDAKVAARKAMVATNDAFTYHEPEKLIKSRSGDECVVALIDQWYLKYGDDEWRKTVLEHVENTLDCYTFACKKAFQDVLDWLKEWACSRSFGLGTQIPWDQQFVIESLSDSTIYMAYYALAKYFHGHDNLKGEKGAPCGFKAEELTDEIFDYIFLKKDMPANMGASIKPEVLKEIRREFEYWYPMDLRVSGKDLVQNHLTMSLYNHAAIWEGRPEMWPRSFYTNGWVLVDGEKMSKSKGNFLTLESAIDTFSADACRLACAYAGDTMEDANFEVPTANKAILKLHNVIEYAEKFEKDSQGWRQGEGEFFVDKWFKNEINALLEEANVHYSRMRFKEALRCAWFDFNTAKDTYYDVLGAIGQQPCSPLMRYWIETLAVIMSIVTPHTCEKIWDIMGRGKEGSVLDARFPTAEVDELIQQQGKYLFDKVKSDLIEKATKASKKKPTKANVYVAVQYPAWKLEVIQMLKAAVGEDGKLPAAVMKLFDKKTLPADSVLISKGAQVGKFAGMVKGQFEAEGQKAFDLELPFKELPLLQENANYLKSKIAQLGIQEVNFYTADAADLPEPETAENAAPGKPSAAFK